MRPLGEALARLETLSAVELRAEWQAVTGSALPRVSPRLLRLALGYELQVAALGGLSRQTQQRLAQIASGKTTTRAAGQGTRLVREWGGKLHVVTIGEDGVIRFAEREWKSLSEIARHITGTRWSGPAFFGLRQNRKAAA